MNESVFGHSKLELIDVPGTLPSVTWQECWIQAGAFLSAACNKAPPERHHLPWQVLLLARAYSLHQLAHSFSAK